MIHPEGLSRKKRFPNDHPETESFQGGTESCFHLTLHMVPGTILGSSGHPD